MKRLKIWIGVLLMGILVFSGPFLCRAQDEPMTNAQFAIVLVAVLGLEMPADADTLSDAELFEIQANMLAERGITLFVDAGPDAQVTRGAVADVLYDALIGPSDVTTEDKIIHLAGLGYMSAGAADDIITFNEVISALNVPALSTAVAEAYSPAPAGAEAGPGAPPAAGEPASEGSGTPI